MDILDSITKGHEVVETINNRLFDVINVPLFTNQNKYAQPNVFGIYKVVDFTNDGLPEGFEPQKPFGVLGKDFTPQQPKALFDSFVRCIMDNNQADLSKMEYHEMKGGAKIRFSIPVKTVAFKNLAGQDDENVISLNIQTGFDGYTATSLYLSMYRMICSNGMKANVTEFKSKFKNTMGNVGKVQLLCDDVTKAIDSGNDLTSLLTKLNSIEINTRRKNDFIKKVLGYNLNDKDQLTTRKRNILQKIEESIALEISRSGGNLWGLLNGITHYTNHQVKTFDTETMKQSDYNNTVNQYIFAEHGEKLNKKAFDVALAMAN